MGQHTFDKNTANVEEQSDEVKGNREITRLLRKAQAETSKHTLRKAGQIQSNLQRKESAQRRAALHATKLRSFRLHPHQ